MCRPIRPPLEMAVEVEQVYHQGVETVIQGIKIRPPVLDHIPITDRRQGEPVGVPINPVLRHDPERGRPAHPNPDDGIPAVRIPNEVFVAVFRHHIGGPGLDVVGSATVAVSAELSICDLIRDRVEFGWCQKYMPIFLR